MFPGAKKQSRSLRIGNVVITALLVFSYSLIGVVQGGETTESSLQSISVFSGYSESDLDDAGDDDYQLIPLMWRFSYDGDYLLAKIGLDMPGRWQLNIEPYFAQVVSPDNRQEIGCGFMLRTYLCSFDFFKKISVFLEGGIGPTILTQDNENQETDFNFIDQIGGGLEIALTNQLYLEITDRFRHISNAGLGDENSGINGNIVMVGMTWRY